MYLFLDRKWTCGLAKFYLWHFRSWYDSYVGTLTDYVSITKSHICKYFVGEELWGFVGRSWNKWCDKWLQYF